jgi:hypothetical protein
MTTQPRRYLAYMLRLWQVDGEGGPTWRASLESPHTGERHGFASLEALCAFLREKTGNSPGQTESQDLTRSPGRDRRKEDVQ